VNRVLEARGLSLVIITGFAVVTLFELLAPLCLVFRGFRYAWLLTIIPFHFLTLLTMKIFFWQNLLLICVLLVNIESLLSKIHVLVKPRQKYHFVGG
jgi:hypothetical protein